MYNRPPKNGIKEKYTGDKKVIRTAEQVYKVIEQWIEDNTYQDYPAEIGFLNYLHTLLCVTAFYQEKCKSYELRPPEIKATGKDGKYYTYGPWECPRCHTKYPFKDEHKYCPECGQKIDWFNKRSAEFLGLIPYKSTHHKQKEDSLC